MTEQNKWIKPWHKLIPFIGVPVLRLYAKWKYGVTVERFKDKGDRSYLILLNHQTVFDQFFVSFSFFSPVYYLATEDIFSNGWVSSVIRFFANPIPIRKQTTDIKAVKTLIRVAREGGTICIAPEGNRTYSGRTEYMNPAIAPLAKKLGLPIVLFKIEGGYGVEPRWSDVKRKGKMRAYVSKVIEPEEYENLSSDELFALIEKGLYIDESKTGGSYPHKKSAEYLERAVYICPYCGLAKFESRGSTVKCTSCGREIIYTDKKELKGKGFDFPFRFVADWYDYQKEFVNSLNTAELTDAPLFTDTATLSQVIVYKNKVKLRKNASVSLYGDRAVIDENGADELTFRFDETYAFTVLGRNKLNIYFGEKLYQLKGDKRFNALKYVHIFNRFKNIKRGSKDVGFLGL